MKPRGIARNYPPFFDARIWLTLCPYLAYAMPVFGLRYARIWLTLLSAKNAFNYKNNRNLQRKTKKYHNIYNIHNILPPGGGYFDKPPARRYIGAMTDKNATTWNTNKKR